MVMTSNNIQLLEQAADLLAQLDDDLYSLPPIGLAKSGVGGHVRHCLDFYSSFLNGMNQGKIDYDSRSRDLETEQDRLKAMSRIEGTISQLREVGGDQNLPLLVKLEGENSPGWCQSSIGRELQFLLSHTVHHYALIAMLLRIKGFDPPPEFGIAPSTLKHWRAKA